MSRSRFRVEGMALGSAAALGLVLAGCPKPPAGADPTLGHRLLGDQPEVNKCFEGTEAELPPGGWERIETEYALSASGKVGVDFSSIVQFPLEVGGSVGGSKRVKIAFAQIREKKLSELYFNAAGNCADEYEAKKGGFASVITQALRAQSLEISGEDEIVAQIKVDVVKIGNAKAETQSGSKRVWTGASLFFADYPECVEVKLDAQLCEDKAVGPGNVCDLGKCSFQVNTMDQDKKWNGTLSCQNGVAVDFAGSLGAWQAGKRVAPGVSYNMRVKSGGSGFGSVTIELRQWQVGTANAARCKAK